MSVICHTDRSFHIRGNLIIALLVVRPLLILVSVTLLQPRILHFREDVSRDFDAKIKVFLGPPALHRVKYPELLVIMGIALDNLQFLSTLDFFCSDAILYFIIFNLHAWFRIEMNV